MHKLSPECTLYYSVKHISVIQIKSARSTKEEHLFWGLNPTFAFKEGIYCVFHTSSESSSSTSSIRSISIFSLRAVSSLSCSFNHASLKYQLRCVFLNICIIMYIFVYIIIFIYKRNNLTINFYCMSINNMCFLIHTFIIYSLFLISAFIKMCLKHLFLFMN